MSWPAQNAGPAPAMTTTFVAGAGALVTSSLSSASIRPIDRALRAAGRFNVNVAIPSWSWRNRGGVMSSVMAIGPAVVSRDDDDIQHGDREARLSRPADAWYRSAPSG